MQIRDLLGANNPAVKALRRAAVDDLIEDSVIQITPTSTIVDGASLLKRMTSLDKGMQTELFGKNADKAMSMLRELGWFQGKIPYEEFEAIVRRSTGGDFFRPTALPELQAALAAQRKLDKEYAAGIVRKFVKGIETADDVASLDPSEFVTRYLDAAKNPGEVATVLAKIRAVDPVIDRQIKQKTIEDILRKTTKPSQITLTDLPGEKALDIDAKKLWDELYGDKARTAKLQVVLGNDTLKYLDNLKTALILVREREKFGETVGGLAASSAMTGGIAMVPRMAVAKFVSGVLAHPLVRKWALQPATRADAQALVRGIIVGTPLLEDMSSTFADESGFFKFLNYIGNSLIPQDKTNTAPRLQVPSSDAQLDQFFQQP
jgi:hypothetical protein